jgi:hypothetical protein
MQTLTQTLEIALTRRTRNIAALSGERPGAHTLDTIAECDGRIAACRAVLAFPTEERRDHAIRLLCEGAQMQPAVGNARLTRAAEMDLYADAVSGRLTLT